MIVKPDFTDWKTGVSDMRMNNLYRWFWITQLKNRKGVEMYITIEQNKAGGIKTPYGDFRRTFPDNNGILVENLEKEGEDRNFEIIFVSLIPIALRRKVEFQCFNKGDKWKYNNFVMEEEIPKVIEGFKQLNLALEWLNKKGQNGEE